MRRDEVGLANEKIPSRVEQVPIVGLDEYNKEVSRQEPIVPSIPQEPQVPQVPPIPQSPFVEGNITNMELRDALMNFPKLVNNHFVAQANHGVGPKPSASTPISRIQNFIRTNPPIFHGTKVDEYLQGFIDDVLKLEDTFGVTPREKAYLAAYKPKDVA